MYCHREKELSEHRRKMTDITKMTKQDSVSILKKKIATVSQQDIVETRQRETSERKKLEEKKKNGWRKNSRAKWSTLKRCH